MGEVVLLVKEEQVGCEGKDITKGNLAIQVFYGMQEAKP